MSSPIKPPGDQPPGLPVDDVAGQGGTDRAGRAAEPFREVLERNAEGATEARRGGEVEGVRAIAEDLRAGRIDTETAIDRMIERQLASAVARGLPESMRADLEAELRRALTEDPALLALTKDLERGR
jgi:hypothetical protein